MSNKLADYKGIIPHLYFIFERNYARIANMRPSFPQIHPREAVVVLRPCSMARVGLVSRKVLPKRSYEYSVFTPYLSWFRRGFSSYRGSALKLSQHSRKSFRK